LIILKIKISLLDCTQRRMVLSYRRFGTNHRSRLQGSSRTLEDGKDRLARSVSTKLPFYAA